MIPNHRKVSDCTRGSLLGASDWRMLGEVGGDVRYMWRKQGQELANLKDVTKRLETD